MPQSLEQLSAQVPGSTPALLQWVQTQLAAGHSPAALQHSLVTAGWSAPIAQAATDLLLRPMAAPPNASVEMPDLCLQDGCNALDAGDRHVQVLLSMQRPRLVLLDQLLSPEECAQLIAEARPAMARSRTVAKEAGGEEINPDRTSDGMFFQRGQTPTVRALEARIAHLLQWPVERGEGLQVLNYRPGAQYKPHHDYFNPQDPGSAPVLRRGGQRVATLVIYLNAVSAGGCTYFPESQLRIHPRPGQAVFFRYPRPEAQSLTLHAGDPVLQGEKWIATKWLREQAFA
ncbi:2OG-Fe(II) oxygenase [Comamonas aquatica]|uniref:2OG-Fe(II) oxygenase superfamily n=1 Tax=Comamonas aquatica TaxID=225991 RepID=A0AA35D563_9BURK|nr:2OG-Fe(II) oxygenase [Comamonas aquatica]CAB5652311.1 2OG-Fe(II) oxygenase superfamily [Comamonas aquatica]CAB5669109.1 2OG-Fe(II) oxygenase superfamily [Comamonas aquatica]CAC9173397.1 2OG-Fe(II) oxygenase superfamily [Comamonas aquatica]CAC9680406.1 2OG-Fe(II) oxygenase superfamily [Comamonas aquatica]